MFQNGKLPFSPAFTHTIPNDAYSIEYPISKNGNFTNINCSVATDCADTSKNNSFADIKEYNNNKIIVGDLPPDQYTIILENNIKTYLQKYKKINIGPIQFNSRDFKIYPQEILHPLKHDIEYFIIQQLPLIFPNHSFDISGDIFLIAEQTRHFILPTLGNTLYHIIVFKMYINDHNLFFSKRLYIQLLIESSTQKIIQINYIEIDIIQNDIKSFPFVPRSLNREFIETTGKLFLTSPFGTNQRENGNSILQQILPNEPVASSVETTLGQCFSILQNETIASTKEECTSKNGIWDTPVSFDNECPFFMSNKNYPNSFGGKQGNSCSLPLGTQPLGYRFTNADPQNLPLCYNCHAKDRLPDNAPNVTLGHCCQEQYNTREYPTLDGPDYAFPYDSDIRKSQQSLFVFRGLDTT
jgi:hypothetical protein